MIKADIAEIEKLAGVLSRAAANSEDVLIRLRQVSGEMHNDAGLSAYPQSVVALEALSMAIDALNRGNDTLQSLRNVIFPVASVYQENEQKNKDKLNRMAAAMEGAGIGFHAAIVSDNIAQVGHSNAINTQNRIQQLTVGGTEEIQVTNIAVVTKAVKEDFEINVVKDLFEE